jgi:putative FmdB family regulatory protein
MLSGVFCFFSQILSWTEWIVRIMKKAKESVMLVYEYYCDACSKKFEIGQSMHDAPIDICPDCKGGIRRIFSGGSGFVIKKGSRCRTIGSDPLREDSNMLRKQHPL